MTDASTVSPFSWIRFCFICFSLIKTGIVLHEIVRGVQKYEVIASCHFTQLLFNFQRRLGDKKRKRKPRLANDFGEGAVNAQVKEIRWQIFQNKSPAQKASQSLMEIHIHLGPDSSHEASDLADSTPSYQFSHPLSLSSAVLLYFLAARTPLHHIALPWRHPEPRYAIINDKAWSTHVNM